MAGAEGIPSSHPQTGEFVNITVEGKEVRIHRGNQTISTIKNLAGVPLVDQLQLERPDGSFEQLDQNGSITIKGGEKFVVFPGTGKSS